MVAFAVAVNRRRVGAVIDCERFGSSRKLLVVTALVFKFIQVLKAKRNKEDNASPELITRDINLAEELWIHDIQNELSEKPKFNAWDKEFRVFRDEKRILRCGDRLQNAYLSNGQKHPCLLDDNHYGTLLIVKHYHEKVGHKGTNETLTELRSKFWITRG